MATSKSQEELELDDYLNEIKDIAQGHRHSVDDIDEPIKAPEGKEVVHLIYKLLHYTVYEQNVQNLLQIAILFKTMISTSGIIATQCVLLTVQRESWRQNG